MIYQRQLTVKRGIFNKDKTLYEGKFYLQYTELKEETLLATTPTQSSTHPNKSLTSNPPDPQVCHRQITHGQSQR